MMKSSTGCGGGTCGCSGGAVPVAPASVNGVALHGSGPPPEETDLREAAWSELLRQEAVRQGLLPRHEDAQAPALSRDDQQIIEDMLERTVALPAATEEECRRYYESRKTHLVQGELVRARHILFAVTAGVDVHQLAARAEQTLLELRRQGVDPGRFAELASQLSNCPSGAQGGDLGRLAPQDCADELANELFHQPIALSGIGLRPRLVHSRYGFHIVEVLERKAGRQPPFEEVHPRIAVQLARQSRAKALHQYMQLLAGGAVIEGVALEGAGSPLVQ